MCVPIPLNRETKLPLCKWIQNGQKGYGKWKMCQIRLSPTPCLGHSCKFPWWVAYYAFMLSRTHSKLFPHIEKAVSGAAELPLSVTP